MEHKIAPGTYLYRASFTARNLFLLTTMVVALTLGSRAQAQTGDAAITTATGTVQVIHAGKTLTAVVGTPVFNGDEVDTAAASSATVTLLDKSTLEIGELSKVKLDIPSRAAANSTTAQISLLAGVVRSFVVHAVAAGAPSYEVHTPNAVAAARGTKFDVTYQDGVDRKEFKGCRQFTDVAVYDGVVQVANAASPTGQSVDLNPGYKSTVPCALLPTAPAAIAAAGSTLGAGAVAAGVVAAVAGGVIGGVAASGGFSGPNNPPPASPSR
ncbi:MAG TPA: FecR family protein [Candidatus Binataceae bacterium]|nr:FecR family protein [Candidatus Binataceae bacterium]